jgi:Mrp family chromosome partitioning ATPase/capsular polysaccharide biosynthesis protein
MDSERSPGATFVHYLRILQRRFWIVIVPVLLAPVMAYLISDQQSARYEAGAAVLLRDLNLAESLNGLPTDQSLATQPERIATTEAKIARASEVARLAIRSSGVDMTPAQFLANSGVSPDSNSNLLNFSFTSGNPGLSVRLANAYAQAYTRYSSDLRTGPLQQALNEVSSRLKTLREKGQAGAPLYADLLAKRRQILAAQALQTSNTVVVRSADGAAQVAPRPATAALLGFGIGLILALGLAFAAEALDTRIRSEEAIQAALTLPLLARIPGAGGRGRREAQLAMLDESGSPQSEAIRMLRTALQFVALKRDFHLLLVTSPQTGDGKTTTVANLGVALARGGRDVILCDLDARKPSLSGAFGRAERRPGFTDIVLGQTGLEDALIPIDVSGTPEPTTYPIGDYAGTGQDSTQESGSSAGRLRLLPFGTFSPPDPGEFVSTEAVQLVLKDLRTAGDIVLIDSAPVLTVGDTLELTRNVDAILLVVRASAVTRKDLVETRRLIEISQSPTIGFILTDTKPSGAMYGYVYSRPGPIVLESDNEAQAPDAVAEAVAEAPKKRTTRQPVARRRRRSRARR